MYECPHHHDKGAFMSRLSREENRKAWLYASLIVLMMLLLSGLILFLLTLPRSPRPSEMPSPSGAGQALRQAAEALDRITVDAVFDPEKSTLSATQTLYLQNRTGQQQEAVMLRSYSGAYLQETTSPAATDEMFLACYGDMFVSGGLKLSEAQVDGRSVIWAWQDTAQTVLSLPADWPAGETVRVTLTYEVAVPDCASRFGQQSGIFALGNVFPTPAVWMENAWRTDEYVAVGDPFLSECANWSVTLTLPRNYTAAASGYDTFPVREGSQARYTFEALAARDFALVISDRYCSHLQQAGDTLLIACALSDENAQAMLKHARLALESFEKRWGDYQYPTLTLAEVDFPFGGMEYPGLVMIASDVIRAGGDTLAHTVAHETAHQWWAVQVGSDTWYQAWQDESLCEYAVLDLIGDVYGPQAREDAAYTRVEISLYITHPPTAATPGSPLDYFSDLSEYSLVVYQRGAALWLALENLMGKEQLDAALAEYQAQYLFRMASRSDLTEILSRYAGMDVSPLMLDYLDTLMQ